MVFTPVIISLVIGLIVRTCSSFPYVTPTHLFLLLSHQLCAFKLYLSPCSLPDCLRACLCARLSSPAVSPVLFLVPHPTYSRPTCFSILLLTCLLLYPAPAPFAPSPCPSPCLLPRLSAGIDFLLLNTGCPTNTSRLSYLTPLPVAELCLSHNYVPPILCYSIACYRILPFCLQIRPVPFTCGCAWGFWFYKSDTQVPGDIYNSQGMSSFITMAAQHWGSHIFQG